MEFDMMTIALLSLFSIIGGIVASKSKLPPALGLLLVGAAMGPSGLGYMKSTGETDWLITIGAVLLLFITGLEFDFAKLRTLGAKAFVGALFKVGIVFFLTYHSVIFLGFGIDTALFLSLILSFSSTIVIVKVLEQNQMIGRKETPLLLGMLIAEDLFAILALSFMSSVNKSGGVHLYGIVEKLLFSLLVLLAVYAACILFLPHALKWVLRNAGEESLIFVDFLLCMLLAILAEVLGLSSAIGAFLAGSIVASLPHAKNMEKAMAPFSMLASSLFFLAMGTLVNLKSIPSNLELLGILAAIIVISRIVAVSFVTRVFANFKDEQAVFSSFAMFSVGEFSLLIARHTAGFKLDIDLISMSAIVIFLSSLMMAFSVKRTKEGALLIKTFTPPEVARANGKLQVLSSYLNRAFQEFSIESSHSNEVRRSASRIATTALWMFLLFYFYKRMEIGPESAIAARAAFALLAAVFILRMVKSLGSLFASASRMLRPIHASQDPRVGRRIIFNFILVGSCIVIGLYLPFIIFLLGLPASANYVSIALVVFGGLMIYRVASLIQHATGGPMAHSGF